MRTADDIERRLAALRNRMAVPTLPKTGYGILFGRIEELEWVLGRKTDEEVAAG